MDSELLEQLAEAARRLESLLTQEFEALKGQQIDAFEALQAEKRETLEALARPELMAVIQNSQDRQTLTALAKNPLWNRIQDQLDACKRAHQRNELLISRQLDAIRGALATLQSQDPGSTLELYDKLGRVRSSRKSVLSGDA